VNDDSSGAVGWRIREKKADDEKVVKRRRLR
jgi:hypothetical protein